MVKSIIDVPFPPLPPPNPHWPPRSDFPSVSLSFLANCSRAQVVNSVAVSTPCLDFANCVYVVLEYHPLPCVSRKVVVGARGGSDSAWIIFGRTISQVVMCFFQQPTHNVWWSLFFVMLAFIHSHIINFRRVIKWWYSNFTISFLLAEIFLYRNMCICMYTHTYICFYYWFPNGIVCTGKADWFISSFSYDQFVCVF